MQNECGWVRGRMNVAGRNLAEPEAWEQCPQLAQEKKWVSVLKKEKINVSPFNFFICK